MEKCSNFETSSPYEIILASESIQSLYEHLYTMPWLLKYENITQETINNVYYGLQFSQIEFKAIYTQCEKLLCFLKYDLGKNYFSFNALDADQNFELTDNNLSKIAIDSGFFFFKNDEIHESAYLRTFWQKESSLLSFMQLPNLKVDTLFLSQHIYLFSSRRTKDFVRNRWINGIENRKKHGSVLFLARNLSGKFMWEATSILLPRNTNDFSNFKEVNNQADFIEHSKHYVHSDIILHEFCETKSTQHADKQSKSIIYTSQDFFQNWYSENFRESSYKTLKKNLGKQDTCENEYFASTSVIFNGYSTNNLPVSQSKPMKNSIDYCLRDVRLLLSNFGYIFSDSYGLPLQNFQMIYPNQDYNLRMTQLDELSTSDVFSLSVAFRKRGQNDLASILANKHVSPSFDSFISNLGHSMYLNEAKAFDGDITSKDTDYIPYYACDEYQIYFVVSSMLKCSLNRAFSLFERNLVRIIWSEDSFVCKLTKTFQKPKHLEDNSENKFCVIYLFVIPLGNNLFRIVIDDDALFSSDSSNPKTRARKNDDAKGEYFNEDALSGPLSSNTVVSGNVLCPLLRQTCTNYLKKYNKYNVMLLVFSILNLTFLFRKRNYLLKLKENITYTHLHLGMPAKSKNRVSTNQFFKSAC